MLIGLLLRKWTRLTRKATLPRIPVSRSHPRRYDEVILAIGATQTAFGYDALTESERLIWNTALVLSFLTGDRKDFFKNDARVRQWSAAYNGFVAMNLPDAADCVATLVKELAFRTEISPRDRRGDTASLLRLADLNARIKKIEAENNLPGKLNALIEHSYPWTDSAPKRSVPHAS